MPRDLWDTTLEVKTNIPLILARELRSKKPGVVGISTVTDPYQPLEQKYRITRSCLELLLQHDFPAHIQTKSALVTRDIDLITRFSDSQVMVSIGTIHDHERTLLEPYTSSVQERLDALRKLSDAGIRTAIFFGPVYPTITADDIPRILEVFSKSGVSEIWIDRLNLKPGIWETMQRSLQSNQKLLRIFSERLGNPAEYYTTIREQIRKKAAEHHLKIIDAF